MLVEGGDQVCDPSPAIEALHVVPMGLNEQLRQVS
jgi:hypothetical protein